MWQSVAQFFEAAFDEVLTLERQRKVTVAVLILIMLLAAAIIVFIIWTDVFYS